MIKLLFHINHRCLALNIIPFIFYINLDRPSSSSIPIYQCIYASFKVSERKFNYLVTHRKYLWEINIFKNTDYAESYLSVLLVKQILMIFQFFSSFFFIFWICISNWWINKFQIPYYFSLISNFGVSKEDIQIIKHSLIIACSEGCLTDVVIILKMSWN